jgi:hypothetical protein
METATNPFNDFVFLHATPSDQGSFSLATEKALAKLEKFQLPDPTFFILQWIQALVASGAEEISISYDESVLQNKFELTITFDGPGYTRTEVDALYDHVFRSGRDRSVDRLRELALGWLSACSLPISLMCLDSNGRRRLRKSKGKETTEASPTCDHPDGASTPHFLRIEGKGAPHLDEIVKQKCKEVTCRLLLNGDSIGGCQAGVPWPNKPFHNGPSKGVMGATYGSSAASHLTFLRYGVEFVSRTEPSLQPPVIARVSDASLSKNVSQTDVVRDDAYEEFLVRLRSEMKEMGLELTRKRIPSYQRDALNQFIQSYLVSYIDVRVFEDEERLKLMGEEFANLVKFPMFRVAGRSFLSLSDLRAEYQKRGYLLYSLDNRAQLARWDSVLLVLEVEEVSVLKKYFANMTAVSWDEVRALAKGGMQHKLAGARRLAPIVSTNFKFNDETSLKVFLPDSYPSGQALVVEKGKRYGTALPGVNTTVIIESPKTLSKNEMAHLQHSLAEPLSKLLKQLCSKLSDPDISRNHSRMRYAELACELILYLNIKPDVVRKAPILGLEDGSLVSLNDLATFLTHAKQVFLGGAFVEGLESGSLDPMPCGGKLLQKTLQFDQIVQTASVRDRIEQDPDIKFKLRRQTLMRGLSNNPMPEQALKNFANEAAAEAEMMLQMEKEYKEALKGPELFVKPDEERLKQLEEESEADDFVPFDLSMGNDAGSGSTSAPEATPRAAHVEARPKLPSVEQDLDMLRVRLGDFCSTPNAVHIERREEEFTLHLSTIWGAPRTDTAHMLKGDQQKTLTHQIPLEGFLRLSADFSGSPIELLKEGVEQLVIKVLHSYKAEPMLAHQRKRLREWLLYCCRMIEHWSVENRAITNDLLDLPLIPCLGDRVLSLTQLRIQAKRLGETLVMAPGSREANPDPIHDVIVWQSEWRDELLDTLQFPRRRQWTPSQVKRDFDTLLRGALKEMTTVVSGQHDDLISPEVIGKLSGGSSFWTKWRAGFLSWDSDYEKALVNPNHKIGKKLISRYRTDPIWTALLASALFSTINRGLEEVEDRHEKVFLEGLLDTLD